MHTMGSTTKLHYSLGPSEIHRLCINTVALLSSSPGEPGPSACSVSRSSVPTRGLNSHRRHPKFPWKLLPTVMHIMAGTASSMPIRTRPSAARSHSRLDWNRHMPTIQRLYIDEDKTLREVMEAMQEQHNFVAT